MNKKQLLLIYILILVVIHFFIFTTGGLDLSTNTNEPAALAGLILGMEVILLPISGIIFLIFYGIYSAIRKVKNKK